MSCQGRRVHQATFQGWENGNNAKEVKRNMSLNSIETIQISFQFGARMKSKERLPYSQTY